jgi:hypothetical protein
LPTIELNHQKLDIKVAGNKNLNLNLISRGNSLNTEDSTDLKDLNFRVNIFFKD